MLNCVYVLCLCGIVVEVCCISCGVVVMCIMGEGLWFLIRVSSRLMDMCVVFFVGIVMVVSVGCEICVYWMLVMLIIEILCGMFSLRLVMVFIVFSVGRLLLVKMVVSCGFLCNSVMVV